MFKKEDITHYCIEELSLRFQNEEALYNIFANSTDFAYVECQAHAYFIYTDEQLAELREDWECAE
jgi:hypothetical protein